MPLSLTPVSATPRVLPQRPLAARPPATSSTPTPAVPAVASHTWGGYPTYPTYPGTPWQPMPSFWHGLSLIGSGLVETLSASFRLALVPLQWAGMAVVGVLGFGWEVLAAIGRGLREVIDPGYGYYPGYPQYPSYPTYPTYPSYPNYRTWP